VNLALTRVENVLTRTSGFLKTVSSHSLQPYRGCSFGRTLCGAGCYVQHNAWLTQGRAWGTFLEARENAADSYEAHYEPERRWGRRRLGAFSIFMSSATDPFVPQEARLGISRAVLNRMVDLPPDLLILQTHSPAVARHIALLQRLPCELRVHISIETDRERIPGLPPPAASVDARFKAAHALKAAGLKTVITVSPLLPIADPESFFARVAACADAVVLDHFIGGDGTPDGRRTLRTPVPAACARLEPDFLSLAYRDRMAAVAGRHLPTGVNIEGFAGLFTSAH